MSSPHRTGATLVVTLEGDADRRPMRAVWLGVVEGGADRPGRRMLAVDDGAHGWALVMETQIGTMTPTPPPITMLVVKDPAVSDAVLEELAHQVQASQRDPGRLLIVPTDVMDQVDLVQVQDRPDAPDAVAALRKVLAGQEDDLTPEEVTLCARLRSA